MLDVPPPGCSARGWAWPLPSQFFLVTSLFAFFGCILSLNFTAWKTFFQSYAILSAMADLAQFLGHRPFRSWYANFAEGTSLVQIICIKKSFYFPKTRKAHSFFNLQIGDITLHHIIKQWTFFHFAFHLWLIWLNFLFAAVGRSKMIWSPNSWFFSILT